MGSKKHFPFSKALLEKVLSHLIFSIDLWMEVVQQKYIVPRSIIEWIREFDKRKLGVSVIWKVVLQPFDLIVQGLAWKVGNGRNVRIGLDPWPCSVQGHLLSVDTKVEGKIITQVYFPTIVFLLCWKLISMGSHLEGSSRVYHPCTMPWIGYQSRNKGISSILLR